MHLFISKPDFLIILISCSSIISCTVALFTQENCPINPSSLVRPTVKIYKNDVPTQTQIITNQTDSISFNSSEFKVIYFDLNCTHNQPVNLIWDEHFIREGIETKCDTTRYVGNFTDPSTYEYSVLYTITVRNPELHMNEGKGEDHSLVFFCQSVDNPCSRNVIRAIYHPSNRTYSVSLLDNNSKHEIEAVTDLETKLAQKLDGRLESCSLMNFTLFYGVKDRNFVYDWKPATVCDQSYLAITAQQLQNMFRFIPTLDEGCINITYVDSVTQATTPQLCSSSSCKLYHRDNHKLKLPLFFASSGNISRVLRAFYPLVGRNFTLPSEGRVDPQNFLQIKVASKELYKGQELNIDYCKTSPYLFSLGVHIGWAPVGDTFPKQVIDASVAEYEEWGAYNVRNQKLRPEKQFLDENSIKAINISCFAPVWNSTSWIVKSVILTLKDSILPIFTNFDARTLIQHRVKSGQDFNLSLKAEGIPRPNIIFTTTNQNLNYTETRTTEGNSTTLTIYFPEIGPSYAGVYTLTAESDIGSISAFQQIVVFQEVSTFIILLSICTGIVLFLFIIAVIISLKKWKRERQEFIRKTEEIVKKFREGFKNEQGITFDTKAEYRHYEVPSSKWDTGGKLLGSGAFGQVHKGFVQIGTNKQVVAVKTVNSSAEVEEFATSLKELTTMSYIGHHDNVVSLIAACTDNIERRSVLIGVEYCANGDLLSYLEKRKLTFQSFVKDGKISTDWTSTLDDAHDISNFSTADLYRWAYQISSGMDYLETKRVLHADLAARNVLLTQDQIAKISDFGLSRQLTESSNYTKTTSCPLPWRWMALESLKFQQFSSKSDVWSYGVTLYELFTLGEVPWPSVGWTLEFVNDLEFGLRLAKPVHTTQAMYNQIMLKCWKTEPHERISFQEINKFFYQAISKLNTTHGKTDDYFNNC